MLSICFFSGNWNPHRSLRVNQLYCQIWLLPQRLENLVLMKPSHHWFPSQSHRGQENVKDGYWAPLIKLFCISEESVFGALLEAKGLVCTVPSNSATP